MTNENNYATDLIVKYNYIIGCDLDLDDRVYPAVNELFKVGHFYACLKVLLDTAKTQYVSLESALSVLNEHGLDHDAQSFFKSFIDSKLGCDVWAAAFALGIPWPRIKELYKGRFNSPADFAEDYLSQISEATVFEYIVSQFHSQIDFEEYFNKVLSAHFVTNEHHVFIKSNDRYHGGL